MRLVNERDYEALERTVTSDFLYLDTAGSPIRGRDNFIAALRELYGMVPDIQIEIDEIFNQESDVLVKGRLLSENPDFSTESLWRIKFGERDMLSEIQAFRDKNSVSVTRLTAHLRNGR